MPAACTLTSEAGTDRLRVWRALADHAQVERRATRHGVTLVYSVHPGVEERLRELVALEAECCAWADWGVETRGDRVVLAVTAPDESVGALHAMFA